MKKLAWALALGLCAALPAAAQDKPVDLKISIWLPPAHPLVPATKEWAESIQKASNGTIRTAIFPSEQLGKAFDHYDMARDGIADLTYVNPGYQPGRFPIIAVGQIPFTFSDAKKGTAALDAWYRKLAATEMKDTHFCFAFIHDPGTYHGRKKVVVPEDIKGMKMRPAQSTIGQMVTMMGGTNVQASAPEARDVLERGVADAITFPWNSTVLFGIDKATKYHMDAALYVTTFVWVLNKDRYEAMSAAQKKVIDDHCNTAWADKIAAPWAEWEAAGRAKIKEEPGHEVYQLSSEQLAAWRKAAAPLTAQWAEGAKRAGVDPDKALADLKNELGKYQSAY
jgi:TRAP-type transport system periplasmic protein